MSSGALIYKLQQYKNPIFITVCGILTGSAFYFKEINQYYLIALCFAFFVLFLVLKNKKILLICLSLVFGYLYPFCYFKVFNVDLGYLLEKRNIYIGEILSYDSSSSPFYKKYYLNLKGVLNKEDFESIKSKVLVLGSRYEEYSPGDIVQITGVLKKPKSALLPGFFDERKYLFAKGINYILRADTGTLLFLDSPKENDFKKIIFNLKTQLVSLNQNILPVNNLNIVNGIVFGSRASKLNEKLKEKIQNLGLSHITSASGFNVAILTFAIFSLFRLVSRNTLMPSLLSIFAVLIYSFIADFSPSIIRAAAFIILALIGNIFEKKLRILPGIGLIILVFFLQNPANILDIGLQLSILAFLGIVLFSEEAGNSILPSVDVKYKWLVTILLQSVFAQIMVMPLIVFYFHNIQLLGIIANIIAVPLASIILIIGFLSILLLALSKLLVLLTHLSVIPVFLLELFSNLFLSWINFLDKSPVKQIFLPNINFYTLILVYFFIFYCLLLFFIPFVRKYMKLILPAFAAILLLAAFYTTSMSSKLKIFFLPRYNQEAILVLFPNNKPVYLCNKFSQKDKSFLNSFFKLNAIKNDYFLYNLNEGDKIKNSIPDLDSDKSRIKIKYKDFVFEIAKNYNEKISSELKYVKLPILRKEDPQFNSVFLSLPELVIVNDYKRLSKKSIENINWLKSKKIKSYFLSETGTIAIVSDGKSYRVTVSD